MADKQEQIRSAVVSKLDASNVNVRDTTGEGKSFVVEVESAQFENLSMLKQHQLVMGSLKPLLDENIIHAVSVSTRIPA